MKQSSSAAPQIVCVRDKGSGRILGFWFSLWSPSRAEQLKHGNSQKQRRQTSQAGTAGERAEMDGRTPSCLGRAAVPVKRVWLGLSARLGLRRTTGLGELRKEVRTCEYRDVHVMWEMLGGMDAAPRHSGGGTDAAGKKKKNKNRRKAAAAAAAACSRLVSYCCACAR